MSGTYSELLRAALTGHPNVDPQAAFAVANQEGLSGGIGDGGHAFGPFQLNNAGGIITGKFAGQTPDQINQWAWSPEGLDFALRHIASVASGLHGAPAVTNIVSRFERPADPSGEISRALAALGGTHGDGGAMAALGLLPGAGAGAQGRLQPAAAVRTNPLSPVLALLGNRGASTRSDHPLAPVLQLLAS